MSLPSNRVRDYTSYQINHLLSLRGGEQRASLAKLRRGIGQTPGSMPELWGEFFLNMPESMLSRTGIPTREEWAVYIALTLFALHQQGRDPKTNPMSQEGQTLGTAVSQLVHSEDDRTRIARRFNTFATSSDPAELAHHLRGLVQMLKADGIPLDYPLLASDLYRFLSPTQTERIRLIWGQDFYRFRKKTDNVTEGEEISHE